MYDLCQRHINKAVEIRCHDGTIHRGVVTKVDERHVYLQPLDGMKDGFADGPGVFVFGFGFGIPIALASIAAIAAIGLFWW
ncbi:hypothetical protein QS257_11810 [Terrilactibacillus sp. S3-3]|nr:hypothetical protein QS257_11810 [Terrilactibacillus sp. S3-3]